MGFSKSKLDNLDDLCPPKAEFHGRELPQDSWVENPLFFLVLLCSIHHNIFVKTLSEIITVFEHEFIERINQQPRDFGILIVKNFLVFWVVQT